MVRRVSARNLKTKAMLVDWIQALLIGPALVFPQKHGGCCLSLGKTKCHGARLVMPGLGPGRANRRQFRWLGDWLHAGWGWAWRGWVQMALVRMSGGGE